MESRYRMTSWPAAEPAASRRRAGRRRPGKGRARLEQAGIASDGGWSGVRLQRSVSILPDRCGPIKNARQRTNPPVPTPFQLANTGPSRILPTLTWLRGVIYTAPAPSHPHNPFGRKGLSARIAINGLGRIGRALFRLAWGQEDIAIAAVNDLAEPRILAHLLRHDSISGLWEVPIQADGAYLTAAGRRVPVTSRRSPAEIPWRDAGVQFVVEATGLFRERRAAEGHLRAGADRVIISAPSPDADLTAVMGVNQDAIDPARHRIISNASCTTNAVAPILMLLDRELGIDACSMTTIHCYTNDQPLVDAPHGDPRRSRAAGLSMIPTTTSASPALAALLPQLGGRITCLAVRVPTATVSAVDLVVNLRRDADREAVRRIFLAAERGPLAGIVGTTDEELVSADFRGDPRSVVVDVPLLALPSPRLLKVFAWYDNEIGYTHRLLDLIRHLARRMGVIR